VAARVAKAARREKCWLGNPGNPRIHMNKRAGWLLSVILYTLCSKVLLMAGVSF